MMSRNRWLPNLLTRRDYHHPTPSANRQHSPPALSLHILGNGTQFRLSNLTGVMHSSDPGDTFSFTAAPFTYSSHLVGIDYGPDRTKGTIDDVRITSGPSTVLVDEILYTGVGNAIS